VKKERNKLNKAAKSLGQALFKLKTNKQLEEVRQEN